MTYRLGIDIGPDQTGWATVSRQGDKLQSIDGATVESVVALMQGRVVAGAELTNLDQAARGNVTRGFVQRLGDATPIIVGGTPYGAEALIASLLASVVAAARARHGVEPAAVVLVHDDGLDEYRTGLLTEAARVAGVPMASLVLAARTDAMAAVSADKSLKFPAGLGPAVGASLLGWKHLPDAAIVATSGGIEAGAATGGVAIGAAGTALGASALAGGSSTASAIGPAGTPLSTSGPAGTPLTSGAGPAGTPLTTGAGPAGTPLTTGAGPAGTPLTRPPAPRGRFLRNLLNTPRALAIGAAAATAAVVTVVATSGSDSAPASTETGLTAPVVVESLSECVVGTWTMDNESYASRFETFFASAGGGLTIDISGEVVIEVAPDSTWTITYNGWTITMANDVLQIQMVGTGIDTAHGEFRDDGTFTYSDDAVGVTYDVTATADGVPFASEGLTTPPRVAVGSGTYSCAGDAMSVGTESEFTFDMNRTIRDDRTGTP